jgi:hypothetical protein
MRSGFYGSLKGKRLTVSDWCELANGRISESSRRNQNRGTCPCRRAKKCRRRGRVMTACHFESCSVRRKSLKTIIGLHSLHSKSNLENFFGVFILGVVEFAADTRRECHAAMIYTVIECSECNAMILFNELQTTSLRCLRRARPRTGRRRNHARSFGQSRQIKKPLCNFIPVRISGIFYGACQLPFQLLS